MWECSHKTTSPGSKLLQGGMCKTWVVYFLMYCCQNTIFHIFTRMFQQPPHQSRSPSLFNHLSCVISPSNAHIPTLRTCTCASSCLFPLFLCWVAMTCFPCYFTPLCHPSNSFLVNNVLYGRFTLQHVFLDAACFLFWKLWCAWCGKQHINSCTFAPINLAPHTPRN